MRWRSAVLRSSYAMNARALKHPKTQQVAQNAPLLEPDLFGACAGLRGDELLQVSDGVIRVAFNSDLLSKTIVTNHLDHALNKRDTNRFNPRVHAAKLSENW